MNSTNRGKHQIPKGGMWFARQAPMLEALHSNNGGFAVAWDTVAGKGSKAYGLYPSAEDSTHIYCRTHLTSALATSLYPKTLHAKHTLM